MALDTSAESPVPVRTLLQLVGGYFLAHQAKSNSAYGTFGIAYGGAKLSGSGTVGGVSVGAQAYSLGEGSAKPISKLSITNQQMNPLKALCAIVISQELARTPLVGGTQFLQTELRNAVAAVTDAAFTLALTNSPGTTIAQRSGTRAAFLGDPGSDGFGGLSLGFNITRQIH